MYRSYDGRTYCTPAYDGRTYCMTVMMGGPNVPQL